MFKPQAAASSRKLGRVRTAAKDWALAGRPRPYFAFCLVRGKSLGDLSGRGVCELCTCVESFFSPSRRGNAKGTRRLRVGSCLWNRQGEREDVRWELPFKSWPTPHRELEQPREKGQRESRDGSWQPSGEGEKETQRGQRRIELRLQKGGGSLVAEPQE